MKTEDTELLEALAVALAPPAAEPTPAELAVLARAVADSRWVESPARRPSRPVRRTVVVAVVGSIVLSAGTAAAVVPARPFRARSGPSPTPSACPSTRSPWPMPGRRWQTCGTPSRPRTLRG